MIHPEQVNEFTRAAEAHYDSALPYHNWEGHALAVIAGVEKLAGRLEPRGIMLARGALQVAAAWHDAGFHEDHTKLGFPTKEHYSAALLEEYLRDKDVSEEDKAIMRAAILGTIHGAPRESLGTLVLHRSDIANIGGPYGDFLKNNIAIWKENTLLSGHQTPWPEHVRLSQAYIGGLVEEAVRELPRLGEPIYASGSYDVQAIQNAESLAAEPHPEG